MLSSYNLYRIDSTTQSLTPGQSANFVIGAGVFSKKSFVQIRFNGVQTTNTGDRIYCRKDVFIPAQSQCQAVFDGVNKLQVISLAHAQLSFSQDLQVQNGDRLDQAIGAAGVGILGITQTKKQFTEIGVQRAGLTSGTQFMYYPIEMFFPGIWSDDSEYFKIDSTGVITMNLGNTALTNCLAVQKAGAAASVSDFLENVGACSSIDISLMLRRITNNVEQVHQSIPKTISCYLQQAQSLINGSAQLNISFGANQLSDKQDLAITLQAGALSQFDFEELQSNSNSDGTYNIQRMGVNILSCNTIAEAKSQLSLQKDVYKQTYNNLISTFHTLVGGGVNIQTQLQVPATLNSFAYLGYRYMMQTE